MMWIACGEVEINSGKTPIAKVYDSYLYYEDLGELVPPGSDAIDSAFKVKQYIHVWARQQLMIKKAELYLTPEQRDVERQVQEYRNNLLIYRYKDAFINENLDTVVTEQQIDEYYKGHPDDFVLNTLAIKVIFVQMLATSDETQTVRRLLDFHSEKDSLALIDVCKSNALKFDNYENKWVTLAQVSKDMPQALSEKNEAFKTHGTITFNDGQYIYYMKIRECIPAGGIMPLDMAESSISRILINKRKSKLINDLEQNILDNALESKNIEYFTPEAK